MTIALYRAIFPSPKGERKFTFASRAAPLAADFAYTTLSSYAKSLGYGEVLRIEPIPSRRPSRNPSSLD